MKKRVNSLAERLHLLFSLADEQDIPFKRVLDTLAGRGQAVFLILFSLPFLFPIQIPGLSTPFGLLLCFIGLRIAFGHRSWLPKSLLEKKIPFHILKKFADIAIKISDKLLFLTSARMVWLVQSEWLHIFHGLTISALALLMALPLPIPLTNILVAVPLLAFGLALLEDDGLLLIVAYLLTALCFLAFFALIWYGKEGAMLLFHKFIKATL